MRPQNQPPHQHQNTSLRARKGNFQMLQVCIMPTIFNEKSQVTALLKDYFAIPAHKAHLATYCIRMHGLQRRAPSCQTWDTAAWHLTHFAAGLQQFYTVQHVAEGLEFLQPQSRGPRGQHTTDALAHAAGQHATYRWQILQAFIPRRWILAAPASFDFPAPAPCDCYGCPLQSVPRVAQSILGPARSVSATPPTKLGDVCDHANHILYSCVHKVVC